jgi:restriction system protein
VVTDHPVLQPILANWAGFASLLAILIFFKIFTSPSFKGWFGEWMVDRDLRRLDPSRYRLFHDLYLPHPTEAGTTQIDHAIVSPFGIFVIETKNYRGWIFGGENQREWTQQIHRRKSRFQNPLHQNRLHVRALMRLLDLPDDRFHSVVLFIGNSELKTPMPDNVLNRGLVPWIKRHEEIRLDSDSTEKAIACLEHLQRSTDRRTAARKHLAALRVRHARSHS